MKSRLRTASLILVFAALLFGCGLFDQDPTGTPPVFELMPDLPGYRVIEGVAVRDYITNLAEGAALIAGNPQLILLVEKVDSTIECYEDVGAVKVRIFTDEDFALSSGAIAIADRNRLTDPQTLLRCVGGGLIPFSAEPTIDPCGNNYTLERDENEFYILYVGTTQEICQTFCASLEGCAGQ